MLEAFLLFLFYIFKKFFYIFFGAIKTYISLVILTHILVFLFGIKKTEDSLFELKKGCSYSIFDLHSDYFFNKELFKEIISNRRLFCLTTLMLTLVMIIRPLMVFPTAVFYIYYCYSIFRFKNSRDYHPICLYKNDFVVNGFPSYRACIFLFFIKIPKWVGFTLAYFSWKFFYTREFPVKNYKELVGCFLLTLIAGVSMWTVYVSTRTAKHLVLKRDNLFGYYFPQIIIYLFTNNFNKFAQVASRLKIFKLNNELIFNPSTGLQTINKIEHQVVKIHSPDIRKNKMHYLTHPGLKLEENNALTAKEFLRAESSLHDICVQSTSIPIGGMECLKLKTIEHKKTLTYHCINTVRERNLVVLDYRYQSNCLSSWGITDDEKFLNYAALVYSHRLFSYNGIIRLETLNSTKTVINKNNFLYFLVNKTRFNGFRLNDATMLYVDKIVNRFEKESSSNIDSLKNLYVQSKETVYDFHDNDFKFPEFHEFTSKKLIFDIKEHLFSLNN